MDSAGTIQAACRASRHRATRWSNWRAIVFSLCVIGALTSFPASATSSITDCLRDFKGLAGLTTLKDVESALARLSASLRAQAGLSRAQRANLLAHYAEKVQPELARFSPEERRRIQFSLARSVIAMEQFEPADYRPVDKLSYDHVAGRYVHLSEFPKWAEAYVDRKPPHEGQPFDVLLLPVDVMRDLTTHNHAPIIMKLHDLRHVHYGVGHARPMALYFMSARSENVNRYGILVSLAEGIEARKYQNPHEIRICDHFRSLGMNLEEAMYHVGRATHEQIETWMDQLKLRKKFAQVYSTEWRPTYVPGRETPGEVPARLDAEIDEFIGSLDEYRRDPTKSRYFNYRLERPKAGDPSTWEDEPNIQGGP